MPKAENNSKARQLNERNLIGAIYQKLCVIQSIESDNRLASNFNQSLQGLPIIQEHYDFLSKQKELMRKCKLVINYYKQRLEELNNDRYEQYGNVDVKQHVDSILSGIIKNEQKKGPEYYHALVDAIRHDNDGNKLAPLFDVCEKLSQYSRYDGSKDAVGVEALSQIKDYLSGEIAPRDLCSELNNILKNQLSQDHAKFHGESLNKLKQLPAKPEQVVNRLTEHPGIAQTIKQETNDRGQRQELEQIKATAERLRSNLQNLTSNNQLPIDPPSRNDLKFYIKESVEEEIKQLVAEVTGKTANHISEDGYGPLDGLQLAKTQDCQHYSTSAEGALKELYHTLADQSKENTLYAKLPKISQLTSVSDLGFEKIEALVARLSRLYAWSVSKQDDATNGSEYKELANYTRQYIENHLLTRLDANEENNPTALEAKMTLAIGRVFDNYFQSDHKQHKRVAQFCQNYLTLACQQDEQAQNPKAKYAIQCLTSLQQDNSNIDRELTGDVFKPYDCLVFKSLKAYIDNAPSDALQEQPLSERDQFKYGLWPDYQRSAELIKLAIGRYDIQSYTLQQLQAVDRLLACYTKDNALDSYKQHIRQQIQESLAKEQACMEAEDKASWQYTLKVSDKYRSDEPIRPNYSYWSSQSIETADPDHSSTYDNQKKAEQVDQNFSNVLDCGFGNPHTNRQGVYRAGATSLNQDDLNYLGYQLKNMGQNEASPHKGPSKTKASQIPELLKGALRSNADHENKGLSLKKASLIERVVDIVYDRLLNKRSKWFGCRLFHNIRSRKGGFKNNLHSRKINKAMDMLKDLNSMLVWFDDGVIDSVYNKLTTKQSNPGAKLAEQDGSDRKDQAAAEFVKRLTSTRHETMHFWNSQAKKNLSSEGKELLSDFHKGEIPKPASH